MPLNIPAGFAQVGLIQTLAGDPEPMLSTFGLDISSAGGDLGTLAGDISTILGNVIAPDTNDDITFTGIRVLLGQDGGDPLNIVVPFGTQVQGEDDTPMIPQNSAFLIRKFASVAGRQGRGRMYVPGVAEGAVDNKGMLGSGVAAAVGGRWTDFFIELLTAPSTNDYPHVILHTLGTPIQTPSPVIGVECDNIIATQRRRLRR